VIEQCDSSTLITSLTTCSTSQAVPSRSIVRVTPSSTWRAMSCATTAFVGLYQRYHLDETLVCVPKI